MQTCDIGSNIQLVLDGIKGKNFILLLGCGILNLICQYGLCLLTNGGGNNTLPLLTTLALLTSLALLLLATPALLTLPLRIRWRQVRVHH